VLPLSVSIERALDFVYEHGVLWERALFAHLFEGAPRERVLRCLGCYQNEDGGWGHAIEHDVRAPASHAVAVEYSLAVIREFDLSEPAMLARTAAWCEAQQLASGAFPLPKQVHRYPRAPWWRETQEWPPDAIVGRLAALGVSSPRLLERARGWAERHLTREELAGLTVENWVYRLYHYAEYFLNIEVFPEREAWRAATLEKTVELARAQPDAAAGMGFGWTATLPPGVLPEELVEKALESLVGGQREDGSWPDRHDLRQWQPIQTIWALKTLRDHGRLGS
jgi:hypothetical protein